MVVVTVTSTVLCLYVAALAARFGAAPGWREYRWFALAAATAGAYSILDAATIEPVRMGDRWVVRCVAVQIALAAVHVVAWLRYARPALGSAGRLEDALEALLVAAGILALVPGAAFTGRVGTSAFVALGVAYRVPEPTLLGGLSFAAVLGTFLLLVVRYARARRRGTRGAGVHAASLAMLFALGTNDALVAAGAFHGPYLLDLGLLAPIVAVGWSLTSRFAEDARTLSELRTSLEAQVEDRTRALRRAEDALHRAEQLAVVGQFAAGVAHQVNNPAAVVAASLGYVRDALGSDAAALEAASAVDDAEHALARIVALTRRLRDASRVASTPANGGAATEVGRAAREGVDVTLVRVPKAAGARVELAVPSPLWAGIAHEVLVELVASLVANALEATAGQGPVEITARAAGGRVAVEVADRGPGMAPEVLRRAFEPFFTTRGEGAVGLGLALSRGLAAAAGGELRLDSAPGAGTRATLELALAEPPPLPTPSPGRR